MRIRVSLATAALLGLKNCNLKVKPTTLYFLLSGECKGNCLYCEQKKGRLARVKWPEFDFEDILEKIKNIETKRICILSIYNEGSAERIAEIAKKIPNKAISTCVNAIGKKEMEMLKKAGVERIGIGLDCCSKRVFNKWKKNVPSWEEYMKALKDAKEVFGKVSCHLIVGLGESDKEVIDLMKKLKKDGIKISLFAFSMGLETKVELERYRAIQIARYAIEEGIGKFYFEGEKLKEIKVPIIEKDAFMTAGCPNCNRPFYNERVSKIYNYPYELSEEEFIKAVKEAEKYARICITN
ncbi:MAG: hypothetical protein DRN11_01300 [Thermoplasmata archaeon]|nr:MAG: hypothetical protein DRN11_01300 [Thermoplasmata archaeon]